METRTVDDRPPRVVIVGGGFGGLHAARELRRAAVEVTLIDRSNYHLFQPLLYQVATGGLSPANITAPLRSILRRQKNTTVLLAEVVGFDLAGKRVLLADGDVPFDSLIVAAGAGNGYFGHAEWKSAAPGLKSIEDATKIRGRVLKAFEDAERTNDPAERRRLLTFVIVGGGPTGVELAGALSELSRHALKHDFRRINPENARLILLDGAPHLLSGYPEKLAAKARSFLNQLGVTVRSGWYVDEITPTHVVATQGDTRETIETATVLWAAGVKASPLAERLAEAADLEVDRAGRVAVTPELTLANHPDVFIIGDMASCLGSDGKPLPGVAPVAMQQGKHAAQAIVERLAGKKLSPFRYRDYGSMATIGRSAAVVDMGWLKTAGGFAWLIWLFVHIMQLVSFQNRLLVLFQWAWNYFTRARSARLITHAHKRN